VDAVGTIREPPVAPTPAIRLTGIDSSRLPRGAVLIACCIALSGSGCMTMRPIYDSASVATKPFSESLQPDDYVLVRRKDGSRIWITVTEVGADHLSGTFGRSDDVLRVPREDMASVERRERNTRGTVTLAVIGGVIAFAFSFWVFAHMGP
jgi:hypothetical protein